MESNPLISVIIPAYNAERFVACTIESVLAQTYANWEMIVVDDGSTDSTAAIVQQYAEQDPRIRYIYQQNQRQAAARNRALAEARGGVVAFLDADDLWLPEKLEVSVCEFLEGRQDLLFTDGYQFTDEAQLDDIAALPRFNNRAGTYEGRDGLQIMLCANQVPMLTVLARKEVLQAVGGFRHWAIAEEYDLWLRMLCEGYVLRGIDACLSMYRLHAASLSAADREGVDCALGILCELAERYPGAADYRQAVLPWIRRAVANIKTRGDIGRLRGQIAYWGVGNPATRQALRWRSVIPLRSLQRKLRRAFE